MTPGQTLVVHDSANPISAQVAAILADWHGCGWISGLLSVATAEISAHGADVGNVVATRPAGPSSPPHRLRLRELDFEAGVQLLVLDPVGPDDSWVRNREQLHETVSGLNTTLLDHRSSAWDLLIPWHGGHWDPNLAMWPGWQTLVAAPEESDALTRPGLPLFADLADPEQVAELAAHAAAVAVAACGLWGDGAAAILGRGTGEVRLGRTAHRRMDASAIADLLRSTCLDPKLNHDPNALLAANTEELGKRARAARKQVSLAPMPARPDRPAGSVVTAGEALRMFFSFMFGALRRAPMEIAAGFAHSGRAKASKELRRRLFGSDSAVAVSVGGVVGGSISAGSLGSDPGMAGSRAGWDQESQLEQLWGSLRDIPGMTLPEPGAGVSQRALWSYVVDNSLTLVTGAAQPSADPYLVDGRPRYFDPSQVAPPLVGRWNATSGQLEGIPAAGIRGNDIAAIRSARRQLAAIAADDQNPWRVGAAESLRELDEFAKPWEDSFIGQVGGMVCDGSEHFQARITELLTAAARPEGTAARDAQVLAMDMGRYAKIATGIAGGLVALIVIAGLLFLPGKWVAGLLAATALGWVVALLVKYWRNYRRLFELRHRAQQYEYEQERVGVELPAAVENARRLARIYSQYLFWSPTISAFLRDPFGRPQPRAEQLTGMTGAVPRSVACGVYRAESPRAAQSATRIADSLRPSVPALWSQFLARGRELLIAREPAREPVQVADLLAEAEIGPDSYLAAWLNVALEDSEQAGVRSSAALAHRVDADEMSRIMGTVDQRALASLREEFAVARLGAGAAPSAQRFGPGVQPAAFNPAAFSSFGLHEDYPAVDPANLSLSSSPTVSQRETRHWLDEVDTALVLSHPLLPQGLALRPRSDVDRDTDREDSEASGYAGLGL